MNFSDQWRSPWPISAVFSAPKLLSGPDAAPFGPLLFRPLPSPGPRVLLSSPSLFPSAPPLPHPTSFRDNLQAYFRGVREDFVPSHVQADIIAAVLPESDDSTASSRVDGPVFTNCLHGLRCRDGSMLVLFFPAGENSDHIGYLGLSLEGQRQEILANSDGDAFVQLDGYRHRHHRITKIVVSPADEDGASVVLGGSAVEGYVLATTMYAVNWFVVKIKVFESNSKQTRPLLVPLLKQGFDSPVVHACWNPHFQEESAVLLDNGKLVHVNLSSRQGVTVELSLEGNGLGDMLSCEFGAQPWVLIVAGSNAVVMVDLRSKKNTMPVVLARIESSDSFYILHAMDNDRFVAFCRADYDYLYYSVVTEHHLFLFDVRQPSFPLLTWDHGIDRPSHVSMHKLSQLRNLQQFSWASSSGYAVLVGSFWGSKFKLFYYGPKGRETLVNSCFYAWELPSDISLSGKVHGSADSVLREDFSKENLPQGVDWQLKTELVLGFYIQPREHKDVLSESDETSGFDLIRLTSSGKLESETYYASWHHLRMNIGCKEQSSSKSLASSYIYWDQEETFRPLDVIRLKFLNAYLSDNLSEILRIGIDNPQAVHGVPLKGVACNRELWDLIDSRIGSRSHTVSKAVSDVTFPTSIHEMALRRVLASLPSNLLYLAFSRYPDLFGGSRRLALEFFEVTDSLAQKRLLPFLAGLPSRRSTRWSQKVCRGDSLVGPVLPVPLLLALQQILNDKGSGSLDYATDESLITRQCSIINKWIFPTTSISDSSDPNDMDASQEHQDVNSFFTYDDCISSIPADMDASLSHQRNTGTAAQAPNDIEHRPFTTFICGISETSELSDMKPGEASYVDIFGDLSQVRLDYDLYNVSYSQDEQIVYKSLSKQFLKWQENYQPYRNFCTSKGLMKKPL